MIKSIAFFKEVLVYLNHNPLKFELDLGASSFVTDTKACLCPIISQLPKSKVPRLPCRLQLAAEVLSTLLSSGFSLLKVSTCTLSWIRLLINDYNGSDLQLC